MLADQRFVQSVLSAYEPRLFLCVRQGWEKWVALGLGGQLQFPGRSRACLVYDFTVQALQAELAGDQNVIVVVKDETVKIIFKSSVVLRFKKANESGLGSNTMTQASLSFSGGQMRLLGMPELQPVELLYELNDLHTEISQVVVSARDGDTRLWSYPIKKNGGASAVQIDITKPQEPNLTSRGATVKVREKDDVAKSETGTE